MKKINTVYKLPWVHSYGSANYANLHEMALDMQTQAKILDEMHKTNKIFLSNPNEINGPDEDGDEFSWIITDDKDVADKFNEKLGSLNNHFFPLEQSQDKSMEKEPNTFNLKKHLDDQLEMIRAALNNIFHMLESLSETALNHKIKFYLHCDEYRCDWGADFSSRLENQPDKVLN